MNVAVGTLLALLGLLAAYFYARSSRFESSQADAVADEKATKVSALEVELKKTREEAEALDEKEARKVSTGADATEFLSDSWGPRRGPPN